ncbi:MAG: DUF4390 domain-containing protein [Betaproteobacteria bacterium]
MTPALTRWFACIAALLLWAGLARADSTILLDPTADGKAWLLSADLEPPRTSRLEDAVMKGVSLHFLLEVEVLRPRWYWWDQRIAQFAQRTRLTYHALTREFRVVRDDGPSRSFESFETALAGVAQVRYWRIDPGEQLAPGDYLIQARLRLDSSQLPRPIQVDALTNRDWNPQVEWTRANFTQPPTPTNAR